MGYRNKEVALPIAIFLSSLLFLSGCGVVAYYTAKKIGVKQERRISIDSKPQEAKVYYDGEFIGTTPTYITFVENNETIGTHTLKVERDGYITAIRKFVDEENVGTSYDYPNSLFINLTKREVALTP